MGHFYQQIMLSTLFLGASQVFAQSGEQLALQAFVESAEVQAAIADTLESEGLERGELYTLLQSSKFTHMGFGHLVGTESFLVIQALVGPASRSQLYQTSIIAEVSLDYDSAAPRTTVGEPELIHIGGFVLNAIYAGRLTTQGDETVQQAVERARDIAAEDPVQSLLNNGYRLLSKKLVLLYQGERGGATSALYTGNIVLNRSFDNSTVVLKGYFSKDPLGARTIRGRVE